MPFFLEPLVYDDEIGNEKEFEFARKKPEYVARAIEEFSKPRYGVDVLKVELPINPAFVSGASTFRGGEGAYSRQEAIAHFRDTASATSKPLIYLSSGISDAAFCEMLELAAEAHVEYAGVLCGRATWQDAIPVYANKGVTALEDWLFNQGRQNIQKLNDILAQSATAWWNRL